MGQSSGGIRLGSRCHLSLALHQTTDLVLPVTAAYGDHRVFLFSCGWADLYAKRTYIIIRIMQDRKMEANRS